MISTDDVSVDAALERFGPDFFASMKRTDQRTTALLYVCALLATPGRKSALNIARTVGRPAAAQRFHHLVNVSPWAWQPVRRAVARTTERFAPPQAWVIRQSVFPKAGVQSAGVERIYDSEQGRLLHAQRALDVWAASQELCVPIDWQLLVSDRSPGSRRSRRAPVATADADTEGVLELVKNLRTRCTTTSGAEPTHPPIVMDARTFSTAALVAHLQVLRVPFLIRICRDLLLRSPAGRAQPTPANQLLAASHTSRRPIDPAGGRGVRPVTFGAAVPVVLDSDTTRTGPNFLTLLGLGHSGRAWPAQVWLTSLTGTALPELCALTRLADRTHEEFRTACARTGLRDFTGRSYGGWHRHLTLASAAHAVTGLSRAARRTT